jgi:16S rRNA (guanine(527)-N(7))-methyltransferase RsmG
MTKKIKEKPAEKIWDEFKKNEKLTQTQLERFQKYEALLTEWNKQFNLTAIRNLSGIVRQHFVDSLVLRNLIELEKIKTIADIGTGPGFPSIPLKIIFPDLRLILIEVNKKKQKFLAEVIKILELENVEICDLDWRTFLRTTQEEVNLFVTKAAMDELELCRMFKPACPYKNATLVYWTSNEWQPHPKAEKFVKDLKPYRVGKKERMLVFMGLS